MTFAPGIFEMDAATYHADPCPAPSMSAGNAATITQRTPLHAFIEHPRLNPEHEPAESTGEQDEGTALHALLLEREDRVEVVDAADWRTKAAQEARKAIRDRGRIPLLTARWDDLRRCADAFRTQIAQHEVGDFIQRPGLPEMSMFWEEEASHGPVWCRARADWIASGEAHIFDLKTTAMAAAPDAWVRSSRDAAIRAAHYIRGHRRLVGSNMQPRYFFVLLERQPPYAMSVCELAPSLLTIGEEQHEAARNLWSACLADGQWPGFPPFLATVEATSGMLYGHEDWKARNEQVRQRKAKPFAGQASALIADTVKAGGEIWA